MAHEHKIGKLFKAKIGNYYGNFKKGDIIILLEERLKPNFVNIFDYYFLTPNGKIIIEYNCSKFYIDSFLEGIT